MRITRFVMVLALAGVPRAAGGQTPEIRLDGYVTGVRAVHLGAGVTAKAGTYLRPGIAAAAGINEEGASGRADAFARFHLDPFRERRWGIYGGGGLSFRFDEGRSSRPFLLVLAGIDGPVARGMGTSIEAALGGGMRLGVVVRRPMAEQR